MDRRKIGYDIVSRLAKLLRENGDNILSGESSISLTISCLVMLNDCFKSVSEAQDDLTTSFDVLPGSASRMPPAFHDAQFIYDFVQKVIKLKLGHCGSTIVGRVNLAPFRKLQELEIRQVPLHLMAGLDKQRAQLQVLKVTKCIMKLVELFESCGGDQTAASTWPCLHTVTLNYSMIEKLDNSLRLLPVLQYLDLSHNLICNTDSCLEFLTILELVNLSHNKLLVMPTFALSCCTTLRVLNLRHNFLEHIEGVEHLSALEQLDLADNSISDQDFLQPLQKLTRLRRLMLKGNPISLQKMYRVMTIPKLSPKALTQIQLDGRYLTEKEQSYSSVYCPINQLLPRPPSRQFLVNETASETGGGGYSSLEQSYNLAEMTRPATSASASREKVKRGQMQEKRDSGVGEGERSEVKPTKSTASCNRDDVGECTEEQLREAMNEEQPTTSTTDTDHAVEESSRRKERRLGGDRDEPISSILPSSTQEDTAGDTEERTEDTEATDEGTDNLTTPLLPPTGNSKKGGVGKFSRGKKGRGKRSKKRIVEIEDMEANIVESAANVSDTASGSDRIPEDAVVEGPLQSHEVLQKRLQSMRQQHGSAWLYNLNVQAQAANQKKASFKLPNQNADRDSLGSFQSLDPDAASFKSFEQKSGTEEDDASVNINEAEEKEEEEEDLLMQVFAFPDAESEAAVEEERPGSTDSEKRERSRVPSGPSIYSNSSAALVLEKEEDYGASIELFIVRLHGNSHRNNTGYAECLVSVTDTYILQKDINGDVMYDLALSSLQSAILLEEDVVTDDEKRIYGDAKMPVVSLTFDTIRKDRKERQFVMEDLQKAEVFMDLMHPVLQQKEEEARFKDRFQCLKCDAEFGKNRAIVPVSTIKGEPTEGLLCPKCQSRMVIALDPHQLAQERDGGGSNITTPNGSFTGASQPLASSSRLTTPAKKAVEEQGDPLRWHNSSITLASSYKSCSSDISAYRTADESAVRTTASGLKTSEQFKEDNEAAMKRSTSGTGLDTMNDNKRYLRKNASMQDFSSSSGSRPPQHQQQQRGDWGVVREGGSSSSTGTFTSSHTLVAPDSENLYIRESGSDLGVLENPSNIAQCPGEERETINPAVIRESGSDLDILKNPTVQTLRRTHRRSEPAIRESGSDLWVLPNPSATELSQNLAPFVNTKPLERSMNGTDYSKRLFRRQSSDIQVLETPSRTPSLSTAAEDSEEDQSTADKTLESNSATGAVALSPCGSLTERTVSAMVNDMYRSVYEDQQERATAKIQDDHDGIEVIASGSVDTGSIGFELGNAPECPSVRPGSVENRSAPSLSKGASSSSLTVPTLESLKGDTSLNGSSGSSSDIQVVPVEGSEETELGAVIQKKGLSIDYTHVDHRLKLYFDLTLFKDDEDFKLLIKCPMVQHSKGKEMPGLMVASNSRLYFLHITDTSSSRREEHPEEWLKLVRCLPIVDLEYVDVGPCYQSVRLEFDSPTTTFTLYIRDEDHCKIFVAQFTFVVRGSSFSAHSRLQGISKNSQVSAGSLHTLKQVILKHGLEVDEEDDEEEEEEEEEVDDSLCRVFLAYLKNEEAVEKPEGDPVTLLLTPTHIGLAEENLNTLPSFCQPDACSRQYSYKDRHAVNQIASVGVYREHPKHATLHFISDYTHKEWTWSVAMETENALTSLVNAIGDAFKAIYCVNLNVCVLDTFA